MHKNTSIYLAGPIDDVDDETARGWREETGDGIPLGVVLFSPAHAYMGASRMTAREVTFLNKCMIASTDGLVANLNGPGRGFGTLREIEFAISHGKPCVVVADGTMEVEEHLMMHDVTVVRTLADAVATVVEQVHENREAAQTMFPGIMRVDFPGQDSSGDDND